MRGREIETNRLDGASARNQGLRGFNGIKSCEERSRFTPRDPACERYYYELALKYCETPADREDVSFNWRIHGGIALGGCGYKQQDEEGWGNELS